MAITDQTAATRRPQTSVHLNNATATGRAAARATAGVGGRRPAVTGAFPGIEVSTTVSDLQAPYAGDKVQDGFRLQAASKSLTSGS
jgi:hypothetical protein